MSPEQDEQAAQWRDAFGKRMDGFEARLDLNTEATQRIDKNTLEMVEIFKSWKGAMEVLNFLGRTAKPILAIGALIAAAVVWLKGGK